MGRLIIAACIAALGACASPGPEQRPDQGLAAEHPALPVTAKFDPQPIAGPEHPEQVTLSRCDFTAQIPTDELFPSNRHELAPAGTVRLAREVMAPLAACGALELITVTGFTDRLGPAQLRQTLSERRAEAVKAFMVEHGIPSARISAVGQGSNNPVASGCSARLRGHELSTCLAADRRVMVEVKGIAR